MDSFEANSVLSMRKEGALMSYACRVRFWNGLVCWAIMPKYRTWPKGSMPLLKYLGKV